MTSNERSFPWDDHNGDREYSSDEFAEFFATLFKPGVVVTANFGSGLQITESASLGMRVKFGAGEAFSSFGRNYVHDKDEEVTVPIASTLQDRTDSVAIQFNKSQREAFFVYKESDTTVTRTDSIFELQIAKILVPKNSTQITNANITDMRANESVCGYFSPHGKLNAGDITTQFIAWFEDFKGKLGTDPATNLQLQINDLDSRAVHNTGDEDIAGKKSFEDLQIKGDFLERTATTTISGPYAVSCTLRRTGNLVELVSERKVIGSPTGHEQSDAGISFPSGYRPISRALAKFELNNGNTLYNPMILRIDSNGSSYLSNEAYSGNRYAQSYATWVTNDPWPAN
ncbi:hypothetical protein [Lactococcus lactis]|uniref:hypothetical protein n=1 Tax=Lactococcus lactis TaxID=1358 RepID=UPI001899399C|nr:hypothetical protein [Lactococcus lactis]